MSAIQRQRRPVFVTVIVFVNAFGWLTTEGIWVYFHTTGQIPPVDAGQSYWERSTSAS